MDEKITLDVHYNRGTGSFDCVMCTEIDGEETKQKVGGYNRKAIMAKLVMLLNASLEDMEGEDDWEDD